jgi:hypothetical protein
MAVTPKKPTRVKQKPKAKTKSKNGTSKLHPAKTKKYARMV